MYFHLLSTFAHKFSYNSLKKFIAIHSVTTIQKFLSYLEETYFATTITKFDPSFKKQIISDKKKWSFEDFKTAEPKACGKWDEAYIEATLDKVIDYSVKLFQLLKK